MAFARAPGNGKSAQGHCGACEPGLQRSEAGVASIAATGLRLPFQGHHVATRPPAAARGEARLKQLPWREIVNPYDPIEVLARELPRVALEDRGAVG